MSAAVWVDGVSTLAQARQPCATMKSMLVGSRCVFARNVADARSRKCPTQYFVPELERPKIKNPLAPRSARRRRGRPYQSWRTWCATTAAAAGTGPPGSVRARGTRRTAGGPGPSRARARARAARRGAAPAWTPTGGMCAWPWKYPSTTLGCNNFMPVWAALRGAAPAWTPTGACAPGPEKP